MQQKMRAVLGMYVTRDGVLLAVEAFQEAGFNSCDISVVWPESMQAEEIAKPRKDGRAFHNGGVAARAGTKRADIAHPTAVLDRHEETLLIAGPMAQAPDGAPCERAAEELEAALLMLGLPEYDTSEYKGKVMRGRALLSVHCENADRTAAARRLHGDLGGMDVFTARRAEPMSGKLYRSMAFSAGR